MRFDVLEMQLEKVEMRKKSKRIENLNQTKPSWEIVIKLFYYYELLTKYPSKLIHSTSIIIFQYNNSQH